MTFFHLWNLERDILKNVLVIFYAIMMIIMQLWYIYIYIYIHALHALCFIFFVCLFVCFVTVCALLQSSFRPTNLIVSKNKSIQKLWNTALKLYKPCLLFLIIYYDIYGFQSVFCFLELDSPGPQSLSLYLRKVANTSLHICCLMFHRRKKLQWKVIIWHEDE